MSEVILVVNAGSSSLKFQVHEILPEKQLKFILGGQVSGIGGSRPAFKVKDHAGEKRVDRALLPEQARDLAGAQEIMASWLQERMPEPPVAVGHRIVHGGPKMSRSVLINQEILDYLDSLVPLAPLHQRNNLAPVHVIFEHWPEIRQVACFDTAFHRTQDDIVQHFALPAEYFDKGVRRYGFHGLSYQYIASRLREVLPEIAHKRVIAAHLGSGASACAMVDGVSRETTMGFTALDGLPMGTRPGRLDAGVVLWMLEQGMGHDEIQDLLYNRSGMKGLSGISNDMRTLLASDDPAARLAVDYFTYRTAESVAGLCVAAQGLDALVFTAGVGENAPAIRAGVCRRLEWMGIHLDEAANAANALTISSPESRISVHVVPTNEEAVIAQQTYETLLGQL
ncbi:MAG TPA: acetate/propionate family kinase [Burkholderiaceae bacterium]|nr:acetate/propionate family kinase [Burkholderiaceae bacterium]